MGDLKQMELAARSGLSQGTISLLLRDLAEPKLGTLMALERALPRLRKIREESRRAAA